MHFFPFLFDTRPTSLFLLRRSMLPPSSGANTWTWNDVTLKILGRLLRIFYCFLHKRTSSYSSTFCEWPKEKKKKVILSNRNWTFYSIAFLLILYKSTVLFYLFYCVHSRQKKRMDIFVMCTLGCFFLVYISDVFSQWGYCLPHLQFSFLCYIFRLYLLILGWLCEFIIILLQRTGWACMYKVYYSLLSIMVIDWKKNKKWK